jgi:signal transduction histidine kinase
VVNQIDGIDSMTDDQGNAGQTGRRLEPDQAAGRGLRARRALLTHEGLVAERLHVHALLRFVVAGLIVLGLFIARYVVGVEGLAAGAILAVAGAIIAYNLATWLIVRPYRGQSLGVREFRFLVGVRHVTVAADYLALGWLIWLVGGARSPFVAFFLLHVVLNGMMISRRAAILHAIGAYAILMALVLGEWAGWLHPNLPAGAVGGMGPLDGRYAVTILAVYGMLFVSTTWLLTNLASLLRTGEQHIREANDQLARLSAQRRDFLHLALHNLRSPVGASTMMLKNLAGGLVGPVDPSLKRTVDRCLLRLEEMAAFLSELQTLAAAEQADLDRMARPVDLADLARQVVEEQADEAAMKQHAVEIHRADEPVMVHGIPRLLRECVANLLSNAIKYTPPGGHISITIERDPAQGRITVSDSGIGIAPADRQRLFGQFVRLTQSDPRLGAVSGSGLGLWIVRQVVELHRGRITLDSTPGEGSTFTITVPAARQFKRDPAEVFD